MSKTTKYSHSCMKILIINDLLIGGGAEKVMYSIVDSVLKKGYKVVIGCNDPDDPGGDNILNNVKCIKLQKNRKNYCSKSLRWFIDRAICKVSDIIQLLQLNLNLFDVVIAMKEGPSMKWALKIYSKKRLGWVHVDYNHFHWTQAFFKSDESERKCMSKFDNIVCVSNSTRQAIIDTIGDPGNLCVRYNPINAENIISLSQKPCPIIQSRFPIVITIGRLAYPKNTMLLLEACNQLKDYLQFELWIVGDGPDKQLLIDYIDKYKLENVRMLGNQDNPYSFLKQADIFVSTSISESYGLAIQEALILEIPIIAVNNPAVQETVDPMYGCIIENSVEELCAALKKMVRDRVFLEKCKYNIRHSYPIQSLYEERIRQIEELWN